MKSNFFLSIIFLALVFSSCKDEEQTGCTDPVAVNYDAAALKDDGTCTFNTDEQLIWNNGEYFGWNGNNFTGGYQLTTCYGTSEIIEEQIDSLNSRAYYLFTADEEGRYYSTFDLINNQDARTYGYGNLKFSLKADSLNAPEIIKVFIHGNIHQTNPNCEAILRSEYVEVISSSLNDSTFTEVSIPMESFSNRYISDIDFVCGFVFESEAGSAISIDNIRLSAAKEY